MIYVICDKQELVVETDNLEYVKNIVRSHPDCSIRELGTDKVYRAKLVARPPGAQTPPARVPAVQTPAAQTPAARTPITISKSA